MSLQFQDIWLPLAAGIDQSVDDRVAPVGKLQKADNVEFTKAGALQKRYGFRPIGSTIAGGDTFTDIRGIFSTGRELCVAGDRQLYAYDQDGNTWQERGYIGPFTGKTEVLLRDSFDWYYCDANVDLAQNYVMVGGQRREVTALSGAETQATRVQLGIYDATDMTAIHEPALGDFSTDIYNFKVGRTNQKLLAVGLGAQATGAGQPINVAEWSTAAYNTAPAASASNPLVAGGAGGCQFDWRYRTLDVTTNTADFDWYVAYVVQGRGSYVLDRRNPDHTQQASGTFTAPASHDIHTLACSYDDTPTQYTAFDGVDEYASSMVVATRGGDASEWHKPNDDGVGRSISVWVKTSGAGTQAIFHSHRYGAGTLEGWGLLLDAGRPTIWLCNTDTTSHLSIRSTTTVHDGEWHHITATQHRVGTNNHTVAIYVDGVATSTTTVYNNLGDDSIDDWGTAYVGCTEDAGAMGNYYAGSMANLAVYGAALTAAQALDLYAAGEVMTDYTGLSSASLLDAYWRLGPGDTFDDLLDSTSRSSYSPLTTSFRLNDDGGAVTDEHIVFPSPANIGDADPISMGIWMWHVSTGVADNVIMAKHSDGEGTSWYFEVRDAHLRVLRVDKFGNAGYIYKSGFYLRDYRWHHIAFTHDGSASLNSSNTKIYLDGVDIGATATGSTTRSVTTTGELWIGDHHNSSARAFRGGVCHSCLYTKELTAAEVAALYAAGGVPQDLSTVGPTTDLAHWCALGDGDALGASGFVDLTGNGNHGTSVNGNAPDFEATVPGGGVRNAYNLLMWNMEAGDLYSDAGAVWVLRSMWDAVNNWWEVWLDRWDATPTLKWSRLLFTSAFNDGETDIDYPHTLGVVKGSGTRVVCGWTGRSYDSAISERIDRTRTVGAPDDNSGNDSDCVILPNESLLAGPFHFDGRWYIVCESDFERTTTGVIKSYPYNANNAYELVGLGADEGEEETSEGDRYRLAGTHDIGTASPPMVASSNTDDALGEGASNNVASLGGNGVIYANHFRSRTAYDDAAPWTGEGKPSGINLRGVSTHELTFYPQPDSAAVHQNSAIISGGFCAHYDGFSCLENGFPTPPMPAGAGAGVNSTLGQFSADATPKYIAVWEGIDEGGTVHRSPPSPWVDTEIDNSGSSEDSMYYYFRTVASTLRFWPDHIVNLGLFRAHDDGVYRRCNPRRMNRNDLGSDRIQVYDYGDHTAEVLYTTGGYLESIAPEGFACCTMHNERVWIGGLFRGARVQYSKPVTKGTAAELQFAPEFHESMGFSLPEGEDVRGLASLDDKLLVLSDRAVYAMSGLGPDDAGLNSDFSALTLVTDKVGCDTHRSVVQFPGGVMWQGEGMLHMLTRSLELKPIGEAVRDWLDTYPIVLSADCLPERYQVLVLVSNGTSSCVLVYDYRLDQWVRWVPLDSAGSPHNAVDACVHAGGYYIAEADQVWRYADDTGATCDDTTRYITMDVETGWIQAAKPGGWQRVNSAMLNAEYVDPHKLSLWVYSDWHTSPSQSYIWSDSDLTGMHEHSTAKREQLKLKLVRQKCQAVKIRVSDADPGYGGGISARGCRLFGFGLRLGIKPGGTRVSADQHA